MSTFIKPGFWQNRAKGYKNWLNLDKLVESITKNVIAESTVAEGSTTGTPFLEYAAKVSGKDVKYQTQGDLIIGNTYVICDLDYRWPNSQTSGVFEIGKFYTITDAEILGTDDFSNIGKIAGENCFKATGTTPNDWSSNTPVYPDTDDFRNVGFVDFSVPFVATGTTPTYWDGASIVYEALNDSPIEIVEVFNNVGSIPTWGIERVRLEEYDEGDLEITIAAYLVLTFPTPVMVSGEFLTILDGSKTQYYNIEISTTNLGVVDMASDIRTLSSYLNVKFKN